MPYWPFSPSTATASSPPSPEVESQRFSTAGRIRSVPLSLDLLYFVTIFYRSENVLVDKAEEGNTEERTNLLAPKEGNERTPNSSLSAREISQPSPVGSDRRTPVIEEEPEESDKLL